MGLEPLTSPLPEECSTTELHQPFTTNLTNPIAILHAIQALRERQKILTAPRSVIAICPAPSRPPDQNSPAFANTVSATAILPLPAGLKSPCAPLLLLPTSKTNCTKLLRGAQEEFEPP